MRVYVIYGQGGVFTSYGMYQLAQRISGLYPAAKVTTHDWYNPNTIAADIRTLPFSERVVVIGYSLGANCVTWVGGLVPRKKIDLAVCYDPSVLSIVKQPTPNIARLLLYHNTDWEPEGHAIFTGPQVERTEISIFHLAVCYNETLHQKTLAAISLLRDGAVVSSSAS